MIEASAQLLMHSLVHVVYGLTEKNMTFLWTINWFLARTILRFGLDKASHPLDKEDRVPGGPNLLVLVRPCITNVAPSLKYDLKCRSRLASSEHLSPLLSAINIANSCERIASDN